MKKDNHSIKFGIIAGSATIVFLFLFYWIEKELMLSAGIIWSTTFLYFIGMYMAPLELRKENEGYLDFKTALRAAFIVWVIANAIYHAFQYILYNFLDPDMLNVQKNYMQREMGKLDGMVSEEYLETFSENIEVLNYDLGTVIFTYFSSLIAGFIFSAIIARLVRRIPLDIE